MKNKNYETKTGKKILLCLAASTEALILVPSCKFPEREYEEADRYSIVPKIPQVLGFCCLNFQELMHKKAILK